MKHYVKCPCISVCHNAQVLLVSGDLCLSVSHACAGVLCCGPAYFVGQGPAVSTPYQSLSVSFYRVGFVTKMNCCCGAETEMSNLLSTLTQE